MRIIVGSTAAKMRLDGFSRKFKFDCDIWSDNKTDNVGCVDFSEMPSEIMTAFSRQSQLSGYANIDDLLTIKLSHLPWDIFWNKHASDYLVFKMKYKGVVNKPLYELLKLHWNKVHSNKKNLNLYKTKDEFFDDFVAKEVEHDYLHELVAYPERPLYTRCLKDGQEVMIDRDKFLKLSFVDQVQMFREQINVICLERWVLNTKTHGKIHFIDAYNRSVRKTVTSLTKGWASEFICENLEHFIKPSFKEVEYAINTVRKEREESKENV